MVNWKFLFFSWNFVDACDLLWIFIISVNFTRSYQNDLYCHFGNFGRKLANSAEWLTFYSQVSINLSEILIGDPLIRKFEICAFVSFDFVFFEVLTNLFTHYLTDRRRGALKSSMIFIFWVKVRGGVVRPELERELAALANEATNITNRFDETANNIQQRSRPLTPREINEILTSEVIVR